MDLTWIHPLMAWLQANPNLALIIIFFISLSESLAIIGSIVPGSVTMTAIGILAGSGLLRIDYTLLSSCLGAIAGDSISYAIGYVYSDHLADIWPFKKYPQMLLHGKEFFQKHGGKSVLLGRFFGPLRSIIPVIAGIAHMKQWHFLVANVLSAIGWSLLYVMPGIIVGAAGHELSAEASTKLFIVILLILAAMWLIGAFIRWFVFATHAFLKANLHSLWIMFKNIAGLRVVYNKLTPSTEGNYSHTAGLFLIMLLQLIFFITLLTCVVNQSMQAIDIPIHYLFESIHTNILQAFCIFITQFASPITIGSVFIGSLVFYLHRKKLKASCYIVLLMALSCSASHLLAAFVTYPRPEGLLINLTPSHFLDTQLFLATSLYSFLLYTLGRVAPVFRTVLIIMLLSIGLSSLYLGDFWFSDVLAAYFLGLFISTLLYLFYRKHAQDNRSPSHHAGVLTSFILIIIIASTYSALAHYRQLAHMHLPYYKEYRLDEGSWWNQTKPILPSYRLDRLGKKSNDLNIQYAGDLQILQSALVKAGWEIHQETLWKKLLLRITGNKSCMQLPLFNQLYNNKKPILVMTYQDKETPNILTLTFWESNYSINNANPIWLGSLNQHNKSSALSKERLLSYLLPFLPEFSAKTIKFFDVHERMYWPILIIKEKPSN